MDFMNQTPEHYAELNRELNRNFLIADYILRDCQREDFPFWILDDDEAMAQYVLWVNNEIDYNEYYYAYTVGDITYDELKEAYWDSELLD